MTPAPEPSLSDGDWETLKLCVIDCNRQLTRWQADPFTRLFEWRLIGYEFGCGWSITDAGRLLLREHELRVLAEGQSGEPWYFCPRCGRLMTEHDAEACDPPAKENADHANR